MPYRRVLLDPSDVLVKWALTHDQSKDNKIPAASRAGMKKGDAIRQLALVRAEMNRTPIEDLESLREDMKKLESPQGEPVPA